jgi:hypothetical protein
MSKHLNFRLRRGYGFILRHCDIKKLVQPPWDENEIGENKRKNLKVQDQFDECKPDTLLEGEVSFIHLAPFNGIFKHCFDLLELDPHPWSPVSRDPGKERIESSGMPVNCKDSN